MPTYCSYDSFSSEDWEEMEQNGDLYSCDDPHCGECENWCDGCSECQPEDYYSGRYDIQDIWPVSINSYGHKPSPTFWTVGGFNTQRLSGRFGERRLFMGTEVEMEINSDRMANRSTNAYDSLSAVFGMHEELTERLYCKHDGSLHNGVEIVSHPMSMDAWRELHSMGQLNFYRDLYRCGMSATDRCGQHIHLNKSSFSSMGHMARFTHLVIDNPAYFKHVADRDEEGYASFQRFKICEVIRSNGHVYGPRGAINLQNPATVEVRMFAASLRPKVIMANLELCEALQSYSRNRLVNEKGLRESLTYLSFVEWMADHSDQYPHALIRCGQALEDVTPQENQRMAMSLRRHMSRNYY